MVLPDTLQEKLDLFLQKYDFSALKRASETLTLHYRHFESLVEEEEYAAYLAVRFPATFGVLLTVFQKIPFPIETLLDLGAGPGTSTFAANERWNASIQSTSVEKNPYFLQIAKEFATPSHYIAKDLLDIEELPPHDLVCMSYSFGEMGKEVLNKSWKATKKALVIIEPGTPKGYQNILLARQMLLDKGGFILAPCPHSKKCPIEQGDWCHFMTRIQRTSTHKHLKNASLPFEDEKFSYVIFTKEPQEISFEARLLADPKKRTGHMYLTLCTKEGTLKKEVITKKDPRYKHLRKAKWGDFL